MTRLACLVALAVSLPGCAVKPTEEECRKAIANMQRLMGTDTVRDDARIESEVRRCKGGSKKKAVECAMKATTLDDLRTCDFFKVPPGAKGMPTETPGAGSDTAGSGSAGSAAAGSAAAGSAAAAGSGEAKKEEPKK